MKVAIYARVSTDDQRCQTQLEEARRYCATREWKAAEYVDEGISGTKASRPALDRLMTDALARRIDCILVYKVDRFGRSVTNLSNLLTKLDSAGVRFVAISQGIDTDQRNPTSRFLLNIIACVAQFEAELIRERVLLGVKQYQKDLAEGRPRQSKSGKNLPIGRPRVVVDRLRVIELREKGLSINKIALEIGSTKTTVARMLAGISNES